MLIPSIVLFAGTGINGVSQRLAARLPVGAVRRLAAERDLIPLEDRSTSQLVRIAGPLKLIIEKRKTAGN
jgi:hypothetical protein